MTAAEKILAKSLAASSLDSREWARVQAGLRDRAFFSSRVTSVRFLHAAREMVAEQAAGGKSESEIRRDLRKILAGEKYDAGDAKGTIQDLTSRVRLDLIIKTNVQQARGYARHLEATEPGAVAAFPAQELVRVRARKMPRNWPLIWRNAGGRLYSGGRMIALKDDPVWRRISRFGTPYPPFDFNSGMGVDDIPRAEAIALGVVTDREVTERVERAEADIAAGRRPGFNDNLEADIPFANGEDWQFLKASFGDQIQKSGGTVKWRGGLFREAFEGGNFTFRLGEAQDALLKALPEGVDFNGWKNGSLTVDKTWLNNKRPDGTDHRSHFRGFGDDKEPLELRDAELLPALWRGPDRAWLEHGSRHKGRNDVPSLSLELDAFDGSVLRAVVDIGTDRPFLKTFYKYGRTQT